MSFISKVIYTIFRRKSGRKDKKSNTLRYYKDFEDCILWNFKKVMTTGNLSYLYILEDYHELPQPIEELQEVYEDLSIDYNLACNKKGLQKILGIKKDILITMNELFITGDRSLKTPLNIYNRKLELVLKGGGQELETQIGIVEKKRGFINDKEITLKRWSVYLNDYLNGKD